MEHELDFFTINPEDKIAEKGRILISEPFLADSFFSRSLVYLVDHSDEGSVGFIINKSLDINIENTLDGFENFHDTISMGGPVAANTLHYIHTMGDIIPGSFRVSDNISWGGDLDVIRKLSAEGKITSNMIRFFLGYSGWSAGQLQKELNENSWVIATVKPDTIMRCRSEDSWKTILRGINKKYRIWADFPESPEMN
ncbi:MAG: YqgE/AlgH family protein [Bacteroidales bacterium]|jgi:putative transcriptional regulator|nr:YqgE/AlgH family protein [Bacteroidales bacterium]